ncbi:DUF3169 family protein [Metasolibacillus meyeri]|uniref:DUF3169 family protein n=1 Tax=Metasolibacillus meyeri TaxID=1071052 RepID=UPI000D324717|nr:DUF3169 family protein [Metasolibacillus meyeri]
MIRLVIYVLIMLYSLSKWVGQFTQQSTEANVLMLVNIIGVLALIIAELYYRKVGHGLQLTVDVEQEDNHLTKLESIAYSAMCYQQVALCLGFSVLVIGFILLRESNPQIVLMGFIIILLSLFLMPNKKIMNLTNPNFTLPNPHSKNYYKELVNQYDDGQKHTMLHGLYLLHFLCSLGLVLLALGLMYYSVFSGNSQVISIVGIGVLLLCNQVGFAVILKPKQGEIL